MQKNGYYTEDSSLWFKLKHASILQQRHPDIKTSRHLKLIVGRGGTEKL